MTDDTEVDFKAMTGTGLDEGDIAGIVEIDEDEPVEATVLEEEIPEVDAFGLNGRPKEAEGETEEALDDDYADMEALLMEANGWEDR